MDYEKLYKSAITKLREMVDSQKITVEIAYEICADFIPESEKIRRTLIDMILDTPSVECEKNYKIRKNDVLDWLEKLGEQESVWSEEDKNTIERLIHLLDNEQDNYPQLSCDFQEIQEFKEWLESIKNRYTWKPSNNQNTYKNGVYQEANGVRIWHNGHTFLVPKNWNKGEWSLLNEKGKKNSEREKEHLVDETDALLDWKFIAATKYIQDLGTDIPLKCGEYIITAPVWLAMYKHRIALNKALANMGAMEIDFDKSFWFAQRCSEYTAWYFYGSNKSLNINDTLYAHQVGVITL